ncbi:TRAP transporter substrate-binding protein [Vreelandella glaciei]|uniref:TRAP transporter substrate-binding protein n=1 Tax=Vreelandella glaciei TaxID=186761 RepID=UPI0030ECC086|tara:strand:+ start:4248 stop:5225 length:978 start_codon:yes stop_codon:yes gene_type:complete
MLNRKNAALFSVLTVTLTSEAWAQETWDMALAYPSSNYHSELASDFASMVNENQDEINITTHPGGSLYGGGQIYSSTRRGLVPLGERFISALSNEDAIFGIDAIPFLATNFDEAKALYEASKPKMQEVLEANNLKLLYSVPWPPQGLYVNNEINSIEDMQGVRFRAFDPTTERVAELMGATPTSIEAADLTQAFATGVAESMFGSGSTAYDSKLWEHVDYWYDIGAWLPKNMVIVNLDMWNALRQDTRDVVLATAADIERQGWEKAIELDGWYKEQLADNGMGIMDASDQLEADFEAIGEQMLQDWLDRSGEYGEEIISTYRGES